jgi:predicted RNA-binding Zn ribbon-like protein
MNTQFTPYGDIVEHFESYLDIEDWFIEVNLINSKNLLKDEDQKKYFKELLAFRTLLRSGFKQYIESQTSLDNILQKANEILVKGKVHPQVSNNNGLFELRYVCTEKKNNQLLSRIAIEVIKLISSQEFKYLKKCDNHKCSLFFVDTSRNHSRRWCSMEICGNRSKVNSFTQRKKDLK